MLALLGPSGCGKSTLLRAIAGLEPLAGGQICWDGADLARVPVHHRGFGLMFQDGVLFPHRDVAGNIGYGLQRAGLDRATIGARVGELLELVGLPGYGTRRVATLSGGEAQRVALARALAPRPRLLLLDEPLAALDRTLRERLLTDLRHVLTSTGTTAVFVTHDQGEAFAVADRLAVMRSGRVRQVGSATRDLAAPRRRLGRRVRRVLPRCWTGRRQRPSARRGPAPANLGLRPSALVLDPAGPLTGQGGAGIAVAGRAAVDGADRSASAWCRRSGRPTSWWPSETPFDCGSNRPRSRLFHCPEPSGRRRRWPAGR